MINLRVAATAAVGIPGIVDGAQIKPAQEVIVGVSQLFLTPPGIVELKIEVASHVGAHVSMLSRGRQGSDGGFPPVGRGYTLMSRMAGWALCATCASRAHPGTSSALLVTS